MFWLIAILVTVVACAALYYAAAGRTVNATAGVIDDATASHFRLQLKELDADLESGRLGAAEGQAARGEMARELIRLKGESKPGASAARQTPALLAAIAATAVVAFAAYAYLGKPDLPAAPFASRPELSMTLEDAVAAIETRLAQTPDDLRGWRTVAPAYMQLGRFADAEAAFRRVIDLEGASADSETDLAEAIMMKQGGSVAGEPLTLLASAAARDPSHVRSRFYLAGEATQDGRFEEAVAQWNELLALANGDEPWLETARAGLATATAGLNGDNVPGEAEIRRCEGMLAGLPGVGLPQIDNVSPNLGESYIIDSFMVVVFGGVGNLWGTLVAAMTLGVANKLLEPYAGAVLGKIALLVFIILFIQKRPRGLFALKGRAVEA